MFKDSLLKIRSRPYIKFAVHETTKDIDKIVHNFIVLKMTRLVNFFDGVDDFAYRGFVFNFVVDFTT
jgi:hypothetical protein